MKKETTTSELAQMIESVSEKLDGQINSKWLDQKQAMKLLCISRRTLQTWRDENIIPYSAVGAKLYYKVSDIDKMMMSHHVPKKNNP